MSDVATMPANSGASTAVPPSNLQGAQGTPAPAAAPASGSGGSGFDWASSLNDEMKNLVTTKQWRGPADVVDSYRNLEKLVGAPPESVVKLPSKADDAEGWNKVYSRLGRPEKSDDYNIPMPKEGGSEEYSKWAKGVFHEAGLSKSQAEKVASKWNEFQAQAAKAQAEARNLQNTQEDQSLQKEWGKAYDQNIEQGRQAAKAFGLDGPTIEKLEQALGYAGVMKFMQGIGSKLGEHNFVGGESSRTGFGMMTPGQAQSRIKALQGDKDFTARYLSGDKTALSEMTELQKMAYGE